MKSIFAALLAIAANAECVAQPSIDTCVAQYRTAIKSTCEATMAVDACYCQALPALVACYQFCLEVPANAQGQDEVLRDMSNRCDAAKAPKDLSPNPTAMPGLPPTNQSEPALAYVSDPYMRQTPTPVNLGQTQTASGLVSPTPSSQASMSANATSSAPASWSKAPKTAKGKKQESSALLAHPSLLCTALLALSQYL